MIYVAFALILHGLIKMETSLGSVTPDGKHAALLLCVC